MAQVNRAALEALVDTYVLSSGRRTTAENLRTLLDALIESAAVAADDKDAPGGYPGLDDNGLIDVTQIAQETPEGKFLKDDGTWADVIETVLAAVLTDLDPTPGNVSATDTLLEAIGKLAAKLPAADEETTVNGGDLIPYVPHIANNGSQVTFRLPATANVGDRFYLTGKGAGGWRIAQGVSQQIVSTASSTTSGNTGRLESGGRYDCVVLECITANMLFVIRSFTGTLSFT